MNLPAARNREKSIRRRGWLASIGNEAREHVFADTHVKNCDNVQRQGKGRVRKRQDISSNIHDGAYTSSSVRSMVTRPCSRVHASFSLVFRGISRRFLYRCVEFRVHVEEFIGDELCSPRTRACAITCIRLHACQSHFLSLSLLLSLAFPSPCFQDFSTDSAAYFFCASGFSSTTDRLASSPRVSSAHKRLYTSRLSCTHRAGNARVVRAGARSHRTERKEKKFEVEGSVARYSSTFGSGCQEALFTGFAAQRTINSARCRW